MTVETSPSDALSQGEDPGRAPRIMNLFTPICESQQGGHCMSASKSTFITMSLLSLSEAVIPVASFPADRLGSAQTLASLVIRSWALKLGYILWICPHARSITCNELE
jgi:hypothetical protein